MRRILSLMVLIPTLLSCFNTPLFTAPAEPASVQIKVTVLEASNEGNDFNLENDAYRDQLIKLFSYTAYEQLDSKLLLLPKAERGKLILKDDYELVLTYQGMENNRLQVQGVIRKGSLSYVDTVLSIQNPGVVFLGGPQAGKGVLVIVLETGF